MGSESTTDACEARSTSTPGNSMTALLSTRTDSARRPAPLSSQPSEAARPRDAPRGRGSHSSRAVLVPDAHPSEVQADAPCPPEPIAPGGGASDSPRRPAPLSSQPSEAARPRDAPRGRGSHSSRAVRLVPDARPSEVQADMPCPPEPIAPGGGASTDSARPAPLISQPSDAARPRDAPRGRGSHSSRAEAHPSSHTETVAVEPSVNSKPSTKRRSSASLWLSNVRLGSSLGPSTRALPSGPSSRPDAPLGGFDTYRPHSVVTAPSKQTVSKDDRHVTEARGPIGSTLAAAHPTKSRSRSSTAPDLASASTVRTRIGAQCVARTPIPTLTATLHLTTVSLVKHHPPTTPPNSLPPVPMRRRSSGSPSRRSSKGSRCRCGRCRCTAGRRCCRTGEG